MIDIKELSFRYGRDGNILDGFSTDFTAGRVTSVLGRNGSGKSTLLKNINAILKPFQGCVYIEGAKVADMPLKQIAREMAFLSQRTTGIEATVMDAVLTGRRPHMKLSITEDDRAVAKKVLTQLGLENLACRQTTDISGGELQKVVIARALIQQPRVLLLDEPVNHLDMVNQLEVLQFIRDATLSDGLTTIVVMHDINIALRFSDELLFIKDGEVFAKINSCEINEKIIHDAFELDVEIVFQNGRAVVIPR